MARGKYCRNAQSNYRKDDIVRGAREYAERLGKDPRKFWGNLRRAGGISVDENGTETYERGATWRKRGRRGARARAREQRVLNAQYRQRMMGAQPNNGSPSNSP